MKKNPDHISRSEVLKILYEEKIIPELVKEDWESDGKKPTKWTLQQILNFHNQPPSDNDYKLDETLYTYSNYVHYHMLEIYASHMQNFHLIQASISFPFLSTDWEFFNRSKKKDKHLKVFEKQLQEDDFKDLNNEYMNLIHGAKNSVTKYYSHNYANYDKLLKAAIKHVSDSESREQEFQLLLDPYSEKKLIEGYKEMSGLDPRKLHEYINKAEENNNVDFELLLAPKKSRQLQYHEWFNTLRNSHAFIKSNAYYKEARKVQLALFAKQWLEFENLEKLIPKDFKKKNWSLSPEILGLYDKVIEVALKARIKNL